MQADDRVPAALVRRGQVLDEARRPRSACRTATSELRAQHLGEPGRRSPGCGPRRARAASRSVRPRRHARAGACRRSGSPAAACRCWRTPGRAWTSPARVGVRVDAGRDAAGVEALDDLDQLDHRLAQVVLLAGIEAVRLAHQRAGADQEVAEAGARGDAGVAVMRRVVVGQQRRVLPSRRRRTRAPTARTRGRR